MTRAERGPPERIETLRQALAELLRRRSLDAREISAELRVAEREVPDHLAHLERSLATRGEALVIEPPACKACGHRFEARTRRPSRCPRCKSERISVPRFRIEAK